MYRLIYRIYLCQTFYLVTNSINVQLVSVCRASRVRRFQMVSRQTQTRRTSSKLYGIAYIRPPAHFRHVFSTVYGTDAIDINN